MTPPHTTMPGTWESYERMILGDLTSHGKKLDELTEKHDEFRVEMIRKFGEVNTAITLLQMKSGLWGAAAALLSILLLAGMKWLGASGAVGAMIP